MDNEQFWKLLQPVHREAAAFCRKLAGTRDAGDDLYQSGLLQALRRFGQLKKAESFRPWLYRILVNSYKNRCRSWWLKKRQEIEIDEFERQLFDDPRARLDSRRLLSRLMASLRPEDRALLVLHEMEGWSVSELAAAFNRPEGTIKTRLSRSREKMRKRLEKRLPPERNESNLGEAVYALHRAEKATE